jgi:hypothetical protein
MREWTSEPMNPDPLLIIRNTFTMLARVLLILALIKSENTKTYLLSCIYNQNPKTTLLYCISYIIVLVYIIALLFIFLQCYFMLLTFNTLSLTTTQWSWGYKTRRLFCRLSDKNEESFFDCSLRI